MPMIAGELDVLAPRQQLKLLSFIVESNGQQQPDGRLGTLQKYWSQAVLKVIEGS